MSDYANAWLKAGEEARAWQERAEAAEAEVARLREAAAIADKLELGWHKPYTDEMERRQDAEAEVARLKDGLRQLLDCKGSYNGTVSERGGEPAVCTKCEDIARALLAEDGAAFDPKGEFGKFWKYRGGAA